MPLIDPIEIAMAAREREDRATAGVATGLCPVCSTPMLQCASLGHPALFCAQHNIVLPELPE